MPPPFHAGGQAGKERPLPHPQNPDRATREDADVRCSRVSFGTAPPGAEPSQGHGQRQPSGIDGSSHRRCTVHSDYQPPAGQNRERRSRGDLRCSNGSGPGSPYLQPHPRPHHSSAGCSIYPRWRLFGSQHKHPEPRCIPAAGQRSSADRHLGVFVESRTVRILNNFNNVELKALAAQSVPAAAAANSHTIIL